MPRIRILRCDPSSTSFPTISSASTSLSASAFLRSECEKWNPLQLKHFGRRGLNMEGGWGQKKITQVPQKAFGICCTHFENALLSSIWLRWEPWPPTLNQLAKLTQFYVNIDSISFSVQKILYFGLHVEYRDGWPHQNGWIFGKVPKEEGRGMVIFSPCCRFLTFKQRPFGTFSKIHPFWWQHPSINFFTPFGLTFYNLSHDLAFVIAEALKKWQKEGTRRACLEFVFCQHCNPWV